MLSVSAKLIYILIIFSTYPALGLRLSREKASVQNTGFPRIIHQTWKNNQLPEAFQKWSQSWKDCLPDWEYKLHTDADNRNFIATHFPNFLKTFDNLPHVIQKVDAVRYAYLAIEGGIYVDLDIECFRDPTDLFREMEAGNASALLVRERSNQVSQAFMGAGFQTTPNFFEIVTNNIKPSKDILSSTGPIMFTNAVRNMEGFEASDKGWGLANGHAKQKYAEEPGFRRLAKGNSDTTYMLAHEAMFMPIKWNENAEKKTCLNRAQCLERFPYAYSVSHWTDTWHGKAVPALNFDKTVEFSRCDCLMNALSHSDMSGCPNLLSLTGATMVRDAHRVLLNEYMTECA